MQDPKPRRFLRIKDVLNRVPFSRVTLWRRIQVGQFPRPTYLGPQIPVWAEEEVDAFMDRLLAERADLPDEAA